MAELENRLLVETNLDQLHHPPISINTIHFNIILPFSSLSSSLISTAFLIQHSENSNWLVRITKFLYLSNVPLPSTGALKRIPEIGLVGRKGEGRKFANLRRSCSDKRA
jgi:hypothetical protein